MCILQERTLLSICYKNCIEEKRRSLRLLETSDEHIHLETLHHRNMIDTYRKCIEQETDVLCKELQDLVSDVLLPVAKHDEARVFYLKLKGDYDRYMCEIHRKGTDKWNACAEHAG